MSLYKQNAVYVARERNTPQQVDKFKYIGVVVRAVTRGGAGGSKPPLENVGRPGKLVDIV